jgi:hypothetical protein
MIGLSENLLLRSNAADWVVHHVPGAYDYILVALVDGGNVRQVRGVQVHVRKDAQASHCTCSTINAVPDA